MIDWIKAHKWITGLTATLVLVVGVVFAASGNGQSGLEVATVSERDVRQVISETGTVEANQAVDLAFETTGRVARITASEGAQVNGGDLLMSLDNLNEQAALVSARAGLRSAEAQLAQLIDGTRPEDEKVVFTDVSNAEENLEEVRQTQNQLVESARRDLLSTDLQAYLTSGSDIGGGSYEQPEITGTYDSNEEGEYRISLYRSDANSGYSFIYEGLESGRGSVSTTGPQPLGTRGLYIKFPEDFATSRLIEWVVPIPNTRSSGYDQRKNALETAKKNRQSAISTAEAQLRSARASEDQTLAPASNPQIQAQEAAIEQAEAQVAQAQATLADTTLRAPFSGTVSDIAVTEGEITGPANFAISLVSDADYEITVDIPEADIANLEVGDEATITFDAYEDLSVPAQVVNVSAQAQTVEGVTVVEATLEFTGESSRIKAGLSADVEIETALAENVLALPARAVIERGQQKFVRVVESEGDVGQAEVTVDMIRQQPVETGLRSSDGYIEITSGLESGMQVVTFVPEDMRTQLENSEQINMEE